MSVRINIDQAADEIMSKLEDYRDLAADIVKAAVKDVAEESVYDMQESIERAGIGGTGSYKGAGEALPPWRCPAATGDRPPAVPSRSVQSSAAPAS